MSNSLNNRKKIAKISMATTMSSEKYSRQPGRKLEVARKKHRRERVLRAIRFHLVGAISSDCLACSHRSDGVCGSPFPPPPLSLSHSLSSEEWNAKAISENYACNRPTYLYCGLANHATTPRRVVHGRGSCRVIRGFLQSFDCERGARGRDSGRVREREATTLQFGL